MSENLPARVVTFGELLLRLTAPGHERLVQARAFDARYTGAEANVAVSLAVFGLRAAVVSRVPAHEVGQACINYLRQFGVETDHVGRGGDRLGLLYVEQGAGDRPSAVVYDRERSSFAEALPDDFDWPRILANAAWLHFSGTAPSRGPGIVAAIREGCAAARSAGVRVSCDVNYRSRLWPREEAARVLAPLLRDADVGFFGLADAAMLLGPEAGEGEPREVAARLREAYDLEAAVLSLRSGASASEGAMGVVLCDRDGAWRSRTYDLTMVDRIGGGDALCAGAIYGLLAGYGPQRVVDFAAAAACLKHTIPGDFNLATVPEVERLLAGESPAQVRR